jgi:hypothetical protein
MFFFVWFFVPETKGKSLESMDALFGITDASEKTPSAEEQPAPTIEEKNSKEEAPRARETEVA